MFSCFLGGIHFKLNTIGTLASYWLNKNDTNNIINLSYQVEWALKQGDFITSLGRVISAKSILFAPIAKVASSTTVFVSIKNKTDHYHVKWLISLKYYSGL